MVLESAMIYFFDLTIIMNDTNLHKEIDLIQNCINRMANNSFLLKGWAISIVAIVLTLSEDRTNSLFLFCAVFLPLLCFWYLDTFFLHTETMYRKMYEWVLAERKKDNLDSQYDLNPHRFKGDVKLFCKIMFSKTLRIFYGVPLLIVVFMILYQFKEPMCKWLCGC